MPYWGVVMTHPNQERKVCFHLERQAFEYYAPLERVRTRHRCSRSANFIARRLVEDNHSITFASLY
jgi:hypothetical protein